MLERSTRRIHVLRHAVWLVAMLLLTLAPVAASAAGGIPAPAAAGTQWHVLAGYNTATHSVADANDPYALDIERTDGPTDGTIVLAPMTGTVRFSSSSCVTIRDAAGTSLLLCHLFPLPALRNTTVSRGQPLGVVAPAGEAGNNGVAHIHIALATSSGAPVPFAGEYALEGLAFLPTTEGNAYAGVTFRSSLRAMPGVAAGADQTVRPGSLVTLTPGVTNASGTPLFYRWSQVSGPTVIFGTPAEASTTFTAPSSSATLQLRLSVTDIETQETVADTLTIRVTTTAPLNTPTSATSLLSGSIPATGGFGLVVFGGGSNGALVLASGCPQASAAFWTASGGAFVVFVPASTVATVNGAWTALFPNGIPAGTALIGRCR